LLTGLYISVLSATFRVQTWSSDDDSDTSGFHQFAIPNVCVHWDTQCPIHTACRTYSDQRCGTMFTQAWTNTTIWNTSSHDSNQCTGNGNTVRNETVLNGRM